MIEPARKNFDPKYVSNELDKLDRELTEKLCVYLLGGAVMAIDDLKPGTKDIDVIVEDKKNYRILVSTLKKCGYYLMQDQDLTKEYQKLSATTLENLDKFRWEIFIKYVAKKLVLSDTMKRRAVRMYSGRLLTVFRLSKEDMFLMKSMTERDRDLEDMSLLAKSGIDYNLVFDECKKQTEENTKGDIWEGSLNEKLLELESQYRIFVPFRKRLEKIAEEKMLVADIIGVLQVEDLDQEGILSKLPSLKLTDIQDGLRILLKSGRVLKLRNGKFTLNTDSRQQS